MLQQLTIDHVGHRGDGVAAGPVFVPYTLPAEIVEAECEGERGRLTTLVEASPERIAPFCPLFTQCGGCAIQHWQESAYRDWKRGLVVDALDHAGVEAEVGALVDAHGAGRRRATFHARKGRVGFAAPRSHDIVEIEACPILVPELNAALPAMRALERALRGLGKPLDFAVIATRGGIDCDVRGVGRIPETLRLALTRLAADHGLARLSIHGDVVVERRKPLIEFADIAVSPPPGAFLQATRCADDVLAGLAVEAVGKAKHVADLFCGCGTLSLPLARLARVTAIDSDRQAVAALAQALRGTSGLKPITTEARDLFHRPLLPMELNAFDAVVFDPPRAGAKAQAARIAASKVRRVVAVSCNPTTFAADAASLVAGGLKPRIVTPVDQFRHSAHVEIVALFER